MKNFFYRGNDFQPPYLYILLFYIMGILSGLLGFIKYIESNFAIAMTGIFIGAGQALALSYNWNTKNTQGNIQN